MSSRSFGGIDTQPVVDGGEGVLPCPRSPAAVMEKGRLQSPTPDGMPRAAPSKQWRKVTASLGQRTPRRGVTPSFAECIAGALPHPGISGRVERAWCSMAARQGSWAHSFPCCAQQACQAPRDGFTPPLLRTKLSSRSPSARTILLHRLYRGSLVILLIAALQIKFCWDGSGPKH